MLTVRWAVSLPLHVPPTPPLIPVPVTQIELNELPVFIQAQLIRAIQEGGQRDLVDAVVKFLSPLEKPSVPKELWKTELLQ